MKRLQHGVIYFLYIQPEIQYLRKIIPTQIDNNYRCKRYYSYISTSLKIGLIISNNKVLVAMLLSEKLYDVLYQQKIENSIIMLDTVGCPKEIAKQKADYILALKGDHSGLQDELGTWWHKYLRKGYRR